MKKRLLVFGVAALLLLLPGCGSDELENNAFPLAIGVAPGEEDTFRICMAYPDLQDENALENALSSDVYWRGSADDLFTGADRMSENSSKNIDFNHLKVLVVEKAVFATERGRSQLIAYFQEQKDAAWNTYVFLTDGDLDRIFSDKLAVKSSLGVYLEDLIEEWTNVRKKAHVTAGDLMSQYYNRNETALVPVLEVRGKKPVVKEFEVLKNLNCVSTLSRSRAYESMLAQDELKAFAWHLEDGTRVALHQITAERRIAQTKSSAPELDLHIRATAQIENRLLLTEEEEQKICAQAEQELAKRLQRFLEGQQRKFGLDAADSYLLLAGHNRNLWRQYQQDWDAYSRDLSYRVTVSLTNRES